MAKRSDLEGRSSRIWACHGAADGTTPVGMARQGTALAKGILPGGAALTYLEHGGGHDIPARAVGLVQEFLRQQLHAAPA